MSVTAASIQLPAGEVGVTISSDGDTLFLTFATFGGWATLSGTRDELGDLAALIYDAWNDAP